MKHVKRIVIGLLAMALLLPVIPARAASDAENMAALEASIIESCYYGTEIDITEYDVTLEQLYDLYYSMYDAGKLAWYAAHGFDYEKSQITGNIATFRPIHMSYDKAVYEHRLGEILKTCVLPGMEDWQIALALHDYLVLHGIYDEALRMRDGYSLLVKGKTVCAGYTEVYRELMNRAGVPCVSVASDPMNHIWNLVQIDGNWYHVDITWDDSAPDIYGRVSHEYFLLTDQEIAVGEDPHYDWVTDIKCTDTTFQNWFFRDVESAISFTDVDTCYLVREKRYQNHICRRTISTGKETAVYKEKDVHANAGKGNYYYLHFGLSLWNNRLWLNSLNKVVSMNLNGKDLRTELTYSTKAEKQYILGAYVDKDTLRFTTSTHNGDFKSHERPLEATGYHVHDYTRTVVAPTCGADGYTRSECSCGIVCQSTPVLALTHDWQRTEETASLLKEGSWTETCVHCGETVTGVLPAITIGGWVRQNVPLVGAAALVLILIPVSVFCGKRKKKPAPMAEKLSDDVTQL